MEILWSQLLVIGIGKVQILQLSKNHCNFTWALWSNRAASISFTIILSVFRIIMIRNFCEWRYFFARADCAVIHLWLVSSTFLVRNGGIFCKAIFWSSTWTYTLRKITVTVAGIKISSIHVRSPGDERPSICTSLDMIRSSIKILEPSELNLVP